MRRVRAGSALFTAIVSLHAAAAASAVPPHVALQMNFRPDKPGASTTISFDLTVSRPSPLRTVRLRMPPGMGFATTTLGFATCSPITFQLEGAEGCPADSRVGHGIAYVEAPFIENDSPTNIFETANVTIFFGPIEGQAQIVLFWLEGKWPSFYTQALVARAVPSVSTGRETLAIEAPLLAATPEGPYLDVRGFDFTIGPEGLTYYLHEHGRAIPFKPHGLTVPDRCPRGGYPVEAAFTWWEATEVSRANTHVRCPRAR